MGNYWTSFFLNYLPHIAVALLVVGVIARLVFRNNTIHAKSSQLLQDDAMLKVSLNCFHWGILLVLAGHFLGLFTPRWMYLWLMSVETKRILAITMGSFFGLCAFFGILSLLIRRLRHERVKVNSGWGDIAIEIILTIQIFLGLSSTTTTIFSPISNYLAFDDWAQSVITFQPRAGLIIAEMPIIYKIHIVLGCIIFITLPYSKLMHFFVAPLQYFFRKSYQLVWKRKETSNVAVDEQMENRNLKTDD
ncbi:MAG: respiratory nitrate reductase subunit gamma [Bacteroidales bacterium]|nr:respiratory nitrate reductase subunit gamma [Bacteroidales bacterium]